MATIDDVFISSDAVDKANNLITDTLKIIISTRNCVSVSNLNDISVSFKIIVIAFLDQILISLHFVSITNNDINVTI
jgi:hypothetical protein